MLALQFVSYMQKQANNANKLSRKCKYALEIIFKNGNHDRWEFQVIFSQASLLLFCSRELNTGDKIVQLYLPSRLTNATCGVCDFFSQPTLLFSLFYAVRFGIFVCMNEIVVVATVVVKKIKTMTSLPFPLTVFIF